MLTQTEFIKKLGIGYETLKEYQAQGLFLPDSKSPTEKRIYYREDQLEEFKRYAGISAIEFSKEIGISVSTLYVWNSSGRLKADHLSPTGHLRYSYEQIEKYFAGEYDGIEEEGFIERSRFAQLIGVSESTLISWCKKGLLAPHHKSITRKWQYSPEQIEEAKKIKKV